MREINLSDEYPRILIIVKDHYFLRKVENLAIRESVSSDLIELIQEYRIGTQNLIYKFVTRKFRLPQNKKYNLEKRDNEYYFIEE